MALWNDIVSNFNRGRKSGETSGDRPETDLPVMSFGDHLGELRKRVILALIGAMVGVSICLIFSDTIINAIYQPYLLALRWGGFPVQLYYHKTTGSIISYLMTGFKAGLVVASPWIIYQIWRFVAAGLFVRERRVIYKYIGPSIGLFLLGVAFFFFLVLPVLLKFIISFNLTIQVPQVKPYGLEKSVFGTNLPGIHISRLPTGNQIKPLLIPMAKSDPTHFPKHSVAMWYNARTSQVRIHVGGRTLTLRAQPADALFSPLPTLSEYLSFATIMALIFGVSFELPMVMLILTKVGVVKAAQFRQMWRYAVMALALLAVFLAPTPDFFTFLCIFIPLLLLYVLGVILTTLADRNRARAALAEADDQDGGDSAGPSAPPSPGSRPPHSPTGAGPRADAGIGTDLPGDVADEPAAEPTTAQTTDTHSDESPEALTDGGPQAESESDEFSHHPYRGGRPGRSPGRYPGQSHDISEEP